MMDVSCLIELIETQLLHNVMLGGHPSHHPGIGASWESFIIENILNHLSDKWQYSYYRTSAQAEVDLILEGPKQEVWAIEIKRSLAPKVSKGFHYACEDIKATHKFVIYPGEECFPLAHDIEVMNVMQFIREYL